MGLLLKFVSKKWREASIGGLILTVVILLHQWRMAEIDLKKARVVYENPAVRTVEKIVYKTGPVRIRTVIVKEKGGAERWTVEEDRGVATTETVNSAESAPTPVSVAMKPYRNDRYLLSVGANRLSADFDGKAIFAGYGWKNRFDLQVGGIEKNGFSPWVFATFRF